MKKTTSQIKSIGEIDCFIEYNDGRLPEHIHMPNTVLKTGRTALAKTLSNDIEDVFDFYISRMIFGSSGTAGGVPKFVNESRTGLFGVTVLSKPVIASSVDGSSTTVSFTSVVAYGEGNGIALNEMALQLANGDLYSMRTFPDLNKTSNMQLIFVWQINFI